ncbi:hypothetical protein MHN00_20370 [Alteromonas sp. Cnat2-8]|uniref:hypothetical protein n=1 Tax=Alteromonas sp. Cnat2-8 TaxID=2917728 RepID=UPI001EF60430|nr:hypothetical protein [Alteromonas sp. Cnat2-8]MCG7655899.1 hypothetical protein [Alteromonas sp. Cnat2-8]|tara:strand:+ start:323 stop:526 length:204 start_codon:yes stop_codon:yes gene_type:complete
MIMIAGFYKVPSTLESISDVAKVFDLSASHLLAINTHLSADDEGNVGFHSYSYSNEDVILGGNQKIT